MSEGKNEILETRIGGLGSSDAKMCAKIFQFLVVRLDVNSQSLQFALRCYFNSLWCD